MDNINELSEQIKNKIIETYRLTKKELFESNGKKYGRNWKDLSKDYKEWKKKEIGRIYPIGILYEEMLKGLLNNALNIQVFYDTDLDKINFKIDVDSDRIGVIYADDFNKTREFISFSDEEKKIIMTIVSNTIKDFFGEPA